MYFSNALEALKKGHKVRRSSLQSNQHIIYCSVFESKFVLVTLYDNYLNCPVGYRFTKDDILAEDWEIIEDIPEVELHMKEYFICPACGHENIYFHLNNCKSKCVQCGKIVKILHKDGIQNKNEVNILKEPLKILLPSLKIDTTLPSGTICIRNDTSPSSGSGEIFFGKIDLGIHTIREFKEWLELMVRCSENRINNSINNKRYSEVSDYAVELNVYKQCLDKLNKMLE